MNQTGDREFDLVLLGATGFVGRLTAQHLARHAPAGLRIGLAGRSLERLAAVRGELGEAAGDWALLPADLTDSAGMAALAARTRVVATTAGPYAPHGLALVRACAEAGTSYVDLTGETLFVRRSIEAAHARAQDTGARIVHSCGFDSVPSDLGVGLSAARALADGEGPLREAVLHVRSLRGGVSGGTVDSLREQLREAAEDPEVKAVATDPYALAGESGPDRRRSTARPVRRDPWTKRWAAPFVLGGFNRQIVLRSNALAGWPYGPDFGYREVLDTGSGPVAAITAAGIWAGFGLLVGGMALAPTRRVLDAVLPDPGEGPKAATLDRGRFTVEVDAITETGARYRTHISAGLDPGYRGTAVMLGEAALSLATDPDLPDRAGVLTPMIALGEALAIRLRDRGFLVVTNRLPAENVSN